jgi:K+-transporting ATPase KdpF subunit
MDAELVLVGLVAVALLVFLFYAMLYPERF